ncbi:MAG: hypothetical protein J6K75_02890 [Erysipelotrichaceae bacterium]|nr:hypothetical protein [Erysipelotrichaceae bacterium]MBQ7890309.1 hypothetical protein [Erysipelotrichaceae bacterium]
MKKMMLILAVLMLLSGCSAAKEKAACSLSTGNNTVTITEGRDLSSDKDGQIISMKQTLQIDSEEPDVLVIYKEYYEKQLSEYAADEKMKVSLEDTETGLLITLEFDVKNISASSKENMLEILETEGLDIESVLSVMKEKGFKCGDEEEPKESETTEDENKEAE